MLKRVLITSGPTREYLDPVRFITNGSSGKMGAALAHAVLNRNEIPIVVSGPVSVIYPDGTEIYRVQTTEEMLTICTKLFPFCAGVIGAAAPCDYKPVQFSEQKLSKANVSNGILPLELTETPDVLAALGRIKTKKQWSIGFALETELGTNNVLKKLKQKNCDWMVLNHPEAMDNEFSSVQVFDSNNVVCLTLQSDKRTIAEQLLLLTDNEF